MLRVPFDMVVVGSSLGGVSALEQLLSAIPAEFPVPIVIVQHRSGIKPSYLRNILGRATKLLVKDIETGEFPHVGLVYLAPPDKHLLIRPSGYFALSETEKVNFVRPSVDVLFESAAIAFNSRILAVVLTGKGKDGAGGVQAIKAHGGTVIVQDRASAQAFDMPHAAIQMHSVDFVLPLNRIAPALITLTMLQGAARLLKVPAFRSFYLSQ